MKSVPRFNYGPFHTGKKQFITVEEGQSYHPGTRKRVSEFPKVIEGVLYKSAADLPEAGNDEE